MSEKSQALRLINDLLADVSDPAFIWQVGTLILCIGTALIITRWWRSRHGDGAGRLNEAGTRLAFPLTGMMLTGIALAVLQKFMHVNLLRLAMPQAGWLQPVERWVSWLAWGASILWIAGWWEPLWAELESISWKMGGSRLTLAALIEASFSVVVVMVGALWLAAAIEVAYW